MATSIALILLLGFIVNSIFNKIKLPGLLGMLIFRCNNWPLWIKFIK